MKLWLDDVRPAPDGWTWVGTAQNAIDLLVARGQEVTEASLDHDLGTKQDGNWVAQYIARYKLLEPGTPIRIHSWNPDGARTMAYWLSGAGYPVEVRPYDVDELSISPKR